MVNVQEPTSSSMGPGHNSPQSPQEGRLISPLRHSVALAVSTVVLGVVIGFSSGLLSLLLEGVEQLFLGFQENSATPGPVAVPGWRRLVSVTSGGLVVAVVWWLLRNKTQRVPTVSAAVEGEKMPWWQTLVHVVAQIFFVGTGASIGREVAPREAGTMIAQQWYRFAHRLGLRRTDMRLLGAAGAGAGFAGVYIAPLTGMFFSVEILLKKLDHTTVAVSLGMSAVATLVGGAIKGTQPYYHVGEEGSMPLLVLFALVFSPLFGIVGAYFRKATLWAERQQTTSSAILWQLPLAALITGVAALWAPQLMGNGRALAQPAMNSLLITAVPLLLVWCAAKAFLTIATIKSGASGGTLTPSVAIGASLGAVLGLVCQFVIPGLSVWQCAMLGAVAVLTASQQAPLMALMMLVEITQLPVNSLVPLGLAATISIVISRFIVRPHSVRNF